MSKIAKLGIFGLRRGKGSINNINSLADAEVYAICDCDEEYLNLASEKCPNALKFNNFDDFIKCGIDGVILCNFFHDHAEYAIRAMEAGVHVLSECTAAVTLRDCVRLCETVERTGMKYMLGENYPFQAPYFEAERLISEGKMGQIVYAEGEYNHTDTREGLKELTPTKYHWRAWMPRTYYSTHSLAPLMWMTKHEIVSVSGHAVHSEVNETMNDFRHNMDSFGMLTCMTDKGAMFRASGCSSYASLSGYRVCGENGSVESGRTIGELSLNVRYHKWTTPEGEEQNQTYDPAWPENGEEASKAGHGGSDFWIIYYFVKYLNEDVVPYFDVYRGCAMSAAAILGWRSCLQNGRTYKIPDFRNPEERNKYRDDALTPFPDQNGEGITLPCSTKDAKENWKDLVLPDYE